MTTGFVLYAPNVHTGGGFVLLHSLLKAWPAMLPLTVFLDARARTRIEVPPNTAIFWVRPTLGSRLKAEFALHRVADSGCTVLCFHDLPPLLPSVAHVMVFQQNKIHFGLQTLAPFSFRTRLRLTVERCMSWMFRHRVAEYVVQTPSMRRALIRWHGTDQCGRLPLVRILPFVEATHAEPRGTTDLPDWDFVYVADGEAHKNHLNLFAAWRLLAQDGLRPSLALTLSPRDTVLKGQMRAQAAEGGLRIEDLGQLSHAAVLALYSSTRAMIFPSISESFGLPLVEATRTGLPILASEMDFVRDVCTPAQTFDPASPVSIARAVKRFLAWPEPPLQLLSPQQFWKELLQPPPVQGERVLGMVDTDDHAR